MAPLMAAAMGTGKAKAAEAGKAETHYTGRLSQPAFFVAHSFGITCNSRSGPTLISPVKGRL
jgi:hypothetical protein